MSTAAIVILCIITASSSARRILDSKRAVARASHKLGSSVKRHDFSMGDDIRSFATAAAEGRAAEAPSQKGLRGDAAGSVATQEEATAATAAALLEKAQEGSTPPAAAKTGFRYSSQNAGLPEALAALARTKWLCQEEKWEGSQQKTMTFDNVAKSVKVEGENGVEIEMSEMAEHFKSVVFDTGMVDLLWIEDLPDHGTNGVGGSQAARIRIEYDLELHDTCRVTVVQQKPDSFFVGLVAGETKTTFVGDCERV